MRQVDFREAIIGLLGELVDEMRMLREHFVPEEEVVEPETREVTPSKPEKAAEPRKAAKPERKVEEPKPEEDVKRAPKK